MLSKNKHPCAPHSFFSAASHDWFNRSNGLFSPFAMQIFHCNPAHLGLYLTLGMCLVACFCVRNKVELFTAAWAALSHSITAGNGGELTESRGRAPSFTTTTAPSKNTTTQTDYNFTYQQKSSCPTVEGSISIFTAKGVQQSRRVLFTSEQNWASVPQIF